MTGSGFRRSQEFQSTCGIRAGDATFPHEFQMEDLYNLNGSILLRYEPTVFQSLIIIKRSFCGDTRQTHLLNCNFLVRNLL